MSLGIGPHDLDCRCPRCEARRQPPRERALNLRYELCGMVRAFTESKSMKALAATEMDFEWWFQSLAKIVAEIEATDKLKPDV